MEVISINDKHKDFFEKVFEVVKLIPEGRVTSYGAIANYLGAKHGSRMVGWAMNASTRVPGIAAHRVVNRNGDLSGRFHFPEENMMQKKLESEGIRVVNHRVVDFNVVFWNPMEEISL